MRVVSNLAERSHLRIESKAWRKMTPSERIEARTVRRADGCIGWDGATSGGRPVMLYEGKLRHVYRVLWELTYGQCPTLLHHTCLRPWCINIDHLSPLTDAEHGAAHKRERRHPKG
jgi:hypothetical protein